MRSQVQQFAHTLEDAMEGPPNSIGRRGRPALEKIDAAAQMRRSEQAQQQPHLPSAPTSAVTRNQESDSYVLGASDSSVTSSCCVLLLPPPALVPPLRRLIDNPRPCSSSRPQSRRTLFVNTIGGDKHSVARTLIDRILALRLVPCIGFNVQLTKIPNRQLGLCWALIDALAAQRITLQASRCWEVLKIAL